MTDKFKRPDAGGVELNIVGAYQPPSVATVREFSGPFIPGKFEGTLELQRLPRWANLDGMLHVMGGAVCECDDECRTCGARTHYQPVYGGYIYQCEQCEADRDRWTTGPLPEHDSVGIIGPVPAHRAIAAIPDQVFRDKVDQLLADYDQRRIAAALAVPLCFLDSTAKDLRCECRMCSTNHDAGDEDKTR